MNPFIAFSVLMFITCDVSVATAQEWTSKLMANGAEIESWSDCEAELTIFSGRISQFDSKKFDHPVPSEELVMKLNKREITLLLKGLHSPPHLRFAIHP